MPTNIDSLLGLSNDTGGAVIWQAIDQVRGPPRANAERRADGGDLSPPLVHLPSSPQATSPTVAASDVRRCRTGISAGSVAYGPAEIAGCEQRAVLPQLFGSAADR